MDMTKLTNGDKVVGVSAILLPIFTFLPWFEESVSIDGGDFIEDISRSFSGSGWDVGFLWAGVPVILGLAMLAVVAIRAFSPDISCPSCPGR